MILRLKMIRATIFFKKKVTYYLEYFTNMLRRFTRKGVFSFLFKLKFKGIHSVFTRNEVILYIHKNIKYKAFSCTYFLKIGIAFSLQNSKVYDIN